MNTPAPGVLSSTQTQTQTEHIASTETQLPIQLDTKMVDATEQGNVEEEEQDTEKDEDYDESHEEGSVYVVEAILEHRADFEDGQVRYRVKWKDYKKVSDQTWETEEQFVGARKILEAYWSKIGGKPLPGPSKLTPKKRKRQSAGRKRTSEGLTPKRQGKSSGSKAEEVGSADDDGKETPELLPEVGGGLDAWRPPKASKGAWEGHVQTVDTVEADNNGVFWVYLSWYEKNKDGRFYRTKVKASICYKACPQKMLRFYEEHL